MPDGAAGALSFARDDPLFTEALDPARELLGALMVRPAAVHDLGEFNPAALPTEIDREIFDAVAARSDQEGPIGTVIMAAVALDDPERRSHVAAALANYAPPLPRVLRSRAEHLTLLWQRRRLAEAAQFLTDTVRLPIDANPTEGMIAELEIAIDEIKSAEPVGRAQSFGEAIDEALAGIERACHGEAPGLSTGFRSLDRRLYGLEPGALVVIGARPAIGKTALGQGIAMAAALRGTPVCIFSLEMTAAQLGRRALAAIAGVSLGQMRAGRIGSVEADKLAKARTTLSSIPLFIEDRGGLTVAQIAAKARAMKRRHGIGLLLVDHMHLIRPDADAARMGATWAIGKISNGLKALAKELDVPVVALAQLSRAVEGREDHRPTLADLRQSGEIEQDSDAVMLLHRPEYYLEKSRPVPREAEGEAAFDARVAAWQAACDRVAGVAEAIVAKLRDGEPGVVNLKWNGALTRFEDPEE